MKIIKKMFGGLELTWPKIIICAMVAGIYTAPDGSEKQWDISVYPDYVDYEPVG